MKIFNVEVDQISQQKIEYVYEKLKRSFPQVRFDERDEILGIGEKGYALMCYFIWKDSVLNVKFKGEKPFDLNSDVNLDEYIDKVINLFKEFDYSLKKQPVKSTVVRQLNKALNFDKSNVKDNVYKILNSSDFTAKAVYKISQKREIINYLGSLNYDRTQFIDGSLGSILCILKNIEDKRNGIDFDCSDLDKIDNLILNRNDEVQDVYLKLLDFFKTSVKYRLKLKDQIIIFKRFGLDGKEMTLRQIGELEELSAESIRNSVNKSIIALNKPLTRDSENRFNLLILESELLDAIISVSAQALIKYCYDKGHRNFVKQYVFGCVLKLDGEQYLEFEKAIATEKLREINEEKSKYFNFYIYSQIKFFKKKAIVSDSAWDRLSTAENLLLEDFDRELLGKLITNNTFKDIKCRAINIETDSGEIITPTFQCLTVDNNLIIIDVQKVEKVYSINDVQRLFQIKEYCEKYGFGYCFLNEKSKKKYKLL